MQKQLFFIPLTLFTLTQTVCTNRKTSLTHDSILQETVPVKRKGVGKKIGKIVLCATGTVAGGLIGTCGGIFPLCACCIGTVWGTVSMLPIFGGAALGGTIGYTIGKKGFKEKRSSKRMSTKNKYKRYTN